MLTPEATAGAYFEGRDHRNATGFIEEDIEGRKDQLYKVLRDLGNVAVTGGTYQHRTDLYTAPEGHYLELITHGVEEYTIVHEEGVVEELRHGGSKILWAVQSVLPFGARSTFMDAESRQLGHMSKEGQVWKYVYPENQLGVMIDVEEKLHQVFSGSEHIELGQLKVGDAFAVLPLPSDFAEED